MNIAVLRSHAGTIFALFTLLYCAAAINFSWVQFENNSDTVLAALISIDRYSPFYWSENRFGMLVPLLAMPVRDYGWNLLAQSQLIILAGIGVMVLLARFSRASAGMAAPIAGCVLLAALKPLAALILVLPGSPYFASLFLSLACLWLLFEADGRTMARWSFSLLLVLLSLWVNIGNAVVLAVAIAVYPRRPAAGLKPRVAALLLTVACAAAVLAVSSRYPGSDFTKLLPISSWLGSWIRLVKNLDILVRPVPLALTIAGGAVAWVFGRRVYSPSHAVAAAAGCQILVTGASEWVSKNAYDGRYILAPVTVIAAVALYEFAGPTCAWLQRLLGRSTAVLLCCLLCIATVTKLFGIPSPRAGLHELDRATSDVAGPVRELSCTHVIGSYWNVWETVFNDRMRTGQRRLWGVSHRSDAVRDLWTATPASNRRFCAVCSDTLIEHERIGNGVNRLQKESETGGVCAYREIP